MWETVPIVDVHMSHDLPCPQCGHPAHSYLPCGDACDCTRSAMPGAASPVGLAA